MCLAQGPQRSDADEARTRGLSVSSQALYHWATALPVRVESWLDNILCARYLMGGLHAWTIRQPKIYKFVAAIIRAGSINPNIG